MTETLYPMPTDMLVGAHYTPEHIRETTTPQMLKADNAPFFYICSTMGIFESPTPNIEAFIAMAKIVGRPFGLSHVLYPDEPLDSQANYFAHMVANSGSTLIPMILLDENFVEKAGRMSAPVLVALLLRFITNLEMQLDRKGVFVTNERIAIGVSRYTWGVKFRKSNEFVGYNICPIFDEFELPSTENGGVVRPKAPELESPCSIFQVRPKDKKKLQVFAPNGLIGITQRRYWREMRK